MKGDVHASHDKRLMDKEGTNMSDMRAEWAQSV